MSYLDEQRLKRGDGFTGKDWQKVAMEACLEVDRLRMLMKMIAEAGPHVTREEIQNLGMKGML